MQGNNNNLLIKLNRKCEKLVKLETFIKVDLIQILIKITMSMITFKIYSNQECTEHYNF